MHHCISTWPCTSLPLPYRCALEQYQSVRIYFSRYPFSSSARQVGISDIIARLSLLLTQKINTLESEGKCLPSSGKSTKRASQFDLQLTIDKQKLNSRAYRLGFRISVTPAYRQALPIEKTTKEIKCRCRTNKRTGGFSRCEKRQNQLVGADYTCVIRSKLRMCNLDDVARNRSKPAFILTRCYYKF